MKKTVFLLFIVFLPLFLCGCGGEELDTRIDMTPRQISAPLGLSTEQVTEAIKPAVVGVYVTSPTSESVGSGVCVASGGYILTNNHVIEDASTITLYYANKGTGRARVVWRDSVLDVAILKSESELPFLEMDSAKNLQSGQDVLAMGTPISLQFRHTVTKGIVSALNRTVEISEYGAPTYLQNLVQHDASINPGNSGGPLLNLRGQVVGINTLKVSEAEGMGFAIPVDVFVPILNKLKTNDTFSAPYVGVFGFDSSIASFYGRTLEDSGVFVLSVDSKGPAGLGGILEEDVIKKIDGIEIATMLDLRLALYEKEVGEQVEFSVLRDGQLLTFNVTIKAKT